MILIKKNTKRKKDVCKALWTDLNPVMKPLESAGSDPDTEHIRPDPDQLTCVPFRVRPSASPGAASSPRSA